MNKIVAGLLAAIPLSTAGVIYMLVQGRKVAAELMADDTSGMTSDQWYLIFLVSFALAPFAFGALSGVVCGLVGSPQLFLGIALGLAVLFSIAAVATRTPMLVFKLVANFAVALILGILVPLLSTGWK